MTELPSLKCIQPLKSAFKSNCLVCRISMIHELQCLNMVKVLLRLCRLICTLTGHNTSQLQIRCFFLHPKPIDMFLISPQKYTLLQLYLSEGSHRGIFNGCPQIIFLCKKKKILIWIVLLSGATINTFINPCPAE